MKKILFALASVLALSCKNSFSNAEMLYFYDVAIEDNKSADNHYPLYLNKADIDCLSNNNFIQRGTNCWILDESYISDNKDDLAYEIKLRGKPNVMVFEDVSFVKGCASSSHTIGDPWLTISFEYQAKVTCEWKDLSITKPANFMIIHESKVSSDELNLLQSSNTSGIKLIGEWE